MKTDMISYYSQRAAEYEKVYAKPERQDDLRQLRDRCRALFSGRDVLEVSCGTGYWSEVIAPVARSVLATDINEEVLKIARSKAWENAAIEFATADSYALPRFGRKFSAGFSGFWWSHIPQNRLRAFLEGFHAQLAAGSPMVFIDNRYVAGSSTPISRTDKNGDTFQARTLEDGSMHEVLKNFPSPAELESAIGDLGTDVTVTRFDYFWLLTYQTK